MWKEQFKNRLYVKVYSLSTPDHTEENVLWFREYIIVEKELNGTLFCELSITREQFTSDGATEFKDTLYNELNISWYDLEQTKKNIVIKIEDMGYSVEVVDEDGNIIKVKNEVN